MTTRCAACRRRLHAPSPDGLGPKCRAKLTPPAAPTPGRHDTRARARAGPEQLAIPYQPQLTDGGPS